MCHVAGKNALSRVSPVTVKTAVALRLESKTGPLTVVAVVMGVVFGAHFFAGADVVLTGDFAFRLSCEGAWRSKNSSEVIRGGRLVAARSNYSIRRSIPGRISPHAWPHKASNYNARYRPDTQTYLRRDRMQSMGTCAPSVNTSAGTGLHVIPFLDAAIAVQFVAPLAY